jgi:hypothetical protein
MSLKIMSSVLSAIRIVIVSQVIVSKVFISTDVMSLAYSAAVSIAAKSFMVQTPDPCLD